jgi:hypothetical protein
MVAEQYEAVLGSVFDDVEEDGSGEWGYLFQIKGAPELFRHSDVGKQYRITVEEVSGGEGQAQQGDAEGQASQT